jgi:glycerol-3-phosphate dehydrogenase (NAD+)
MVAALTNESATSKSVYFAHCTSEMIFITHLLAEEPEKLAGPLLADTYVTLLKGRNAWYGQMLAKGELNLDMGDSISGKGMIQVMIQIYFFLQNRFKMHQILQLLTMLGCGSTLGKLWEQPEAELTGSFI